MAEAVTARRRAQNQHPTGFHETITEGRTQSDREAPKQYRVRTIFDVGSIDVEYQVQGCTQ
jgi:hypothetical protein